MSATIRAIHRYPVKSMGGEDLDAVDLASGGLPGDRAYAVRDEKRGGIRGAKKIPALMECGARYPKAPQEGPAPSAEITLPDGSSLSTSDEDAGARISAAVGTEVSLWPLLPAEALDHYRRGAPDDPDMLAELRSMFAREPDEPLPDIGKFPPELLEFESPPGTYFDAFPLLLLTEQSLATMNAAAPGSRFEARRFRPNFLIGTDDGGDPFPELAWIGRELALGEARVSVAMECPRCVMTTHGFDDLPKDPGVMRSLVKEAGGNLGVYATVVRPGRVCVGDAVRLV